MEVNLEKIDFISKLKPQEQYAQPPIQEQAVPQQQYAQPPQQAANVPPQRAANVPPQTQMQQQMPAQQMLFGPGGANFIPG